MYYIHYTCQPLTHPGHDSNFTIDIVLHDLRSKSVDFVQEEQDEVVQSAFVPEIVQKHSPPFYLILYEREVSPSLMILLLK